MSDNYNYYRECYFCGSEDIVGCHEHYIFCKNCTAFYTAMLVIKNCGHLTDGVFPLRMPWYESVRKLNKPYVKEKDGFQYCSICGKEVLVDDW